MTPCLVSKVQSVQNAAARLLTGTRWGYHISPVVHQLHWIPVQRRDDLKLAHFVYSSFCPARHLCTWLTTYTWFRKVQDVGSAHPLTNHALFRARTTRLVTEALLLPGHVFGTASQYTCVMKTLAITVFHVNSKRFGFCVASGVQCDILINCAIQILLLN